MIRYVTCCTHVHAHVQIDSTDAGTNRSTKELVSVESSQKGAAISSDQPLDKASPQYSK